ncbi:MAG: hypothetical protein HYY91_05740 [Candidatus Omnitrophica bacterium]|nr:hypothetical protein [Candidatus Omnitrophota bacterium]
MGALHARNAPRQQLTKAQVKRLRDFQNLTSAQRLAGMDAAAKRFWKEHPEIATLGSTPAEAVRTYCARKRKKLELEVVRDRHGRRTLRVVEMPISSMGSWQ